jgi:hypothetical protein
MVLLVVVLAFLRFSQLRVLRLEFHVLDLLRRSLPRRREAQMRDVTA